MENYDHKKIEDKWQNIWDKKNLYNFSSDNKGEKFYILDMFPYPSGEGLHMGHTESYTSTDILFRYKKMQGFNVLHIQGFDSFGLPAENYAIKTKTPPQETTKKNIENYIRQMKSLGFGYDFDKKVITSSPEYYKWTQWIFTKFFENGLVYKKTDFINWCESCKTGLANEQVEDGKCERCKNEVVQKEIPGWFFKITDFADELIEGLKDIDWPEHTKKNQINWIGKSEGSEIEFKIKDTDKSFFVFTTRADTLFGVTYCVLAPENKLVYELKDKIKNWEEVEKYIEKTKKKTEMERIENKEKTGVMLEGLSVVNPANKEEVPLFVSDYVLASYGTGAVMAVPAHDQRDFEFAKKFDLKIKEVILGGNVSEGAFVEKGVLVNSGKFNGMNSEDAKKAITEFVGGKVKINYRLRDWSVSRQRYWGAPIPIVYSPEGKAHIVPKEHLPWVLPEDVDFVPTGEAPLKKSKELKDRVEKIFGKGWTPEYDTLDTFVCSSWYYLRYPDPKNENEFCSKEKLKKWLPVDIYIGGAEHTYMHLLYARFFTKALNKIGILHFKEPFLKLRHQGMVLDKNGSKMSKSKGNVVNPDDMVERFGADSVRMYMMFAGPLDEDVIWNENNIVGIYRFLERVWKIKDGLKKESSEKVVIELNKLIKKVSDDIEGLKFNTAIASMMTFLNSIKDQSISSDDYKTFIKLLFPFAPHISEEIWELAGESESLLFASWPKYDEGVLKNDKINFVIQVNGKVRGVVMVGPDISENEALEIAKKNEKVSRWIEGKELKKVVFVKGKIINLIV